MAGIRGKSRSAEPRYAGIDVSRQSLTVAWEGLDGDVVVKEFDNDASGRRALCGVLVVKKRPFRITVEATSTYMLDLLMELHEAGAMVMLVNPFQARKFGQANQRRSKTDGIDAKLLLEFARRMPWVAWTPPSTELRELRAIARRIHQVVVTRTAEQNRRHACRATKTTPTAVLADIDEFIASCERREKALLTEAITIIKRAPALAEARRIITSMPGVADRTAVAILGELLMLPTDMTAKQVVAHAGLDPRLNQSGTHNGRAHISRVGNRQIRAALYMPAVTACNCDPTSKAFKERLVANGKASKVAHVAIMRKMLSTMWVMLQRKSMFNPEQHAKGTAAPP